MVCGCHLAEPDDGNGNGGRAGDGDVWSTAGVRCAVAPAGDLWRTVERASLPATMPTGPFDVVLLGYVLGRVAP